MKPAIVAVGYNRPNDLRRLLSTIGSAEYDSSDITLVISLDKATNEDEVLAVANEFEWKHGEKIVRTFSERQGLRRHVLQCGDLSEQYGAVIVLEDDLMVSPAFYRYAVKALEYYKDEPKVSGVALYSHEWNGYASRSFTPVADDYDTYLGQYSITWGQCWTDKWWKAFKAWYYEHEDKLGVNHDIPMAINHWSTQSWGRYFVNYIVEKDLYYVIPRIALSTNCSDIGQHAREADTAHQVRLLAVGDMDYKFAPADKACRYDIFFENKRLTEYLPSDILADGVCINLTGISRGFEKYRYILTTSDLPYKTVRTWGLLLRPVDMNIIVGTEGSEIKLYDTTAPQKCTTDHSYLVLKYESRGLNYRQVDKLSKELFLRAAKGKIKRTLKKVIKKKK